MNSCTFVDLASPQKRHKPDFRQTPLQLIRPFSQQMLTDRLVIGSAVQRSDPEQPPFEVRHFWTSWESSAQSEKFESDNGGVHFCFVSRYIYEAQANAAASALQAFAS